jgi:hypothetical protein
MRLGERVRNEDFEVDDDGKKKIRGAGFESRPRDGLS